jgi:hypothetical protein
MTSVKDIVSGMEYQELTAITGRPHYKSINTIHRQIYDNAWSIESQRGGVHGLLGQIMTPDAYLKVTEKLYNNPPNPGPLSPCPPVVFPHQWADTKAADKRALDEYTMSNNFDKAIKQPLV